MKREEIPCWADPEWDELLTCWVPERGQATTVQGEVLRDAIRLSGEMGNSGLGDWLQPNCTETYEAYADTVLRYLCDGTFDEDTTAFIMRTVEGTREYGRGTISAEAAPGASDVDDLAGLAILWCLKHPEPIPRSLDERMAF